MKYAIIDFRTSIEEKENLIKLGAEIIICPPCRELYGEVCGHPDMLLHFIDKHTAVVHRNIDKSFIKKLENIGIDVLLSECKLTDRYPEDIILNALDLPELFVHNLKYTDHVLLNNIKNKKLINVNQGYTKCSSAIIGKNAVVTSDTGIYTALLEENVNLLQIPYGDILLPNFDYGFIGGCCGSFDDCVVFFGDLSYYSYGEKMLAFLKKHNMKPVFLRKGKLIDRGSIFFI
ncbi:MAG: hypothetical protein LKE46_01000 [Clostridium sp.]|jgi:hypothetical protein|uniref:DUF6873 family GME fold protein n=1 Tax=Clostridium sp. TaxID=1506 RepID=UPI0025C2C25F|nr:hypothetical protein [Clostridium sp.]MCH3962829.1 hypothetical protein [Clostridium sp.]MCI1715756.1 hypothetical protein [Clostridium sp.]MCI1800039.1 hypothetical protein [Clostridium sp.]MCI1813953.1 hypothetical protein [Clostridium sp.]MCI1870851.1 hypothetical protein [Clostridium sp.]